jgi:hypothetical protein
VIGLSKIDLIPKTERKSLPKHIDKRICIPFSGVTGEGTPELIDAVGKLLSGGVNG